MSIFRRKKQTDAETESLKSFLDMIAPSIVKFETGKVRAFFMKLAGFPLHSMWTSEEYLTFLQQNGWTVRKSVVLKASFPLTYTECMKSEV